MSIPFSKLSDPSSNQPNDTDGWHEKLVGKIILNNDEETALSSDEYVRVQDLPTPHRVLPPGTMATMDFRPERLNVHVDQSKRCTGVKFG
ncbi:hypothetical protein EDC96DRAFT_506529 [Choanephora cucurbitarum]|nr:hypothetical protein EDC96DRAFT_506529 [Choanephora cucurbitarum]